MAARLGNKEKFYLRPAGQVEKYNWLAAETANSLNRTLEAVETSDKSTDWAQFIGGKRGGTIEATAYADDTPSDQVSTNQQLELLKSLHNGSRVYVFVGQVEASGSPQTSDTLLEGDLMYGIISGISDTNDFGGVASRTFNLTIDGEIEYIPED